jgi:hypothetical protein
MCIRNGETHTTIASTAGSALRVTAPRHANSLKTRLLLLQALGVLLKIRGRTGAGEGIRTLDPNLGKAKDS